MNTPVVEARSTTLIRVGETCERLIRFTREDIATFARLTGDAKYFSMAVAAADGLLRYLNCPTPGLWYDRIDADGQLVDEPAPASSFYHLVAAIAEISALARFS